MTSSLVGSEMCIRDSENPISPCLPDPRGQIFGGCNHVSATATFTVPVPCLLYTSDAADDM
eukprot:12488484-Prorocentrum_lima.AAC.1